MAAIELKKLGEMIPTSLDDIFRVNRDHGALSLATEADLRALAGLIEPGPVRHTLVNWMLIKLSLQLPEQARTEIYWLFGFRTENGRRWITSEVQGVDLERMLVKTNNSLYSIAGAPGDESDIYLPALCATLNRWGIGRHFGVLPFYL